MGPSKTSSRITWKYQFLRFREHLNDLMCFQLYSLITHYFWLLSNMNKWQTFVRTLKLLKSFHCLFVKKNFNFQNLISYLLSAWMPHSNKGLLDSKTVQINQTLEALTNLSHRRCNSYHWFAEFIRVHFAWIKGFEFNPVSATCEISVTWSLFKTFSLPPYLHSKVYSKTFDNYWRILTICWKSQSKMYQKGSFHWS